LIVISVASVRDKDNAYFQLVLTTVYDLSARMKGAATEIAPDELHHTWEEICYFGGNLSSGSHIELLL
jgi:hypothetical protein